MWTGSAVTLVVEMGRDRVYWVTAEGQRMLREGDAGAADADRRAAP